MRTAVPEAATNAPTTASTPGGGALPAWLDYDSATRTFTAKDAPLDALPFKARVDVTPPSGAPVPMYVFIGQPQ